MESLLESLGLTHYSAAEVQRYLDSSSTSSSSSSSSAFGTPLSADQCRTIVLAVSESSSDLQDATAMQGFKRLTANILSTLKTTSDDDDLVLCAAHALIAIMRSLPCSSAYGLSNSSIVSAIMISCKKVFAEHIKLIAKGAYEKKSNNKNKQEVLLSFDTVRTLCKECTLHVTVLSATKDEEALSSVVEVG